MKPFWVGQHAENLLRKTIDELVEIYPDKTRENLARRKREK